MGERNNRHKIGKGMGGDRGVAQGRGDAGGRSGERNNMQNRGGVRGNTWDNTEGGEKQVGKVVKEITDAKYGRVTRGKMGVIV